MISLNYTILLISSFQKGANKSELPSFKQVEFGVDFPQPKKPNTSRLSLIFGQKMFISGNEIDFPFILDLNSPGFGLNC